MSVRPDPAAFNVSLEARCAQLERQLKRERQIRLEAESIAERGLREAYLTNQRFELLCNVTNAANQSVDPLDTLRYAIAEICAVNDWAFANVLLRKGHGGDARLEGCGLWHARHPDQMFAFIDLSSRLIAWPCAIAPGRLLIHPAAVWTRDIQASGDQGRSGLARQCNLRASISVPVMLGQDLFAVMEFFTQSAVEPDPQQLEVLTQIGTQIGRVFRRTANEKLLIENALRDPLTQLPNRAQFENRLEAIFQRNTGAASLRTSLIYIDLDGFKLVNDALGHQAGDRLLVEMAGRLRQVADAYATTPYPGAPESVLIARIGGDEFIILVEGEQHWEDAADIAKDIHSILRPSFVIDRHEARCAASIGIAHDDGSYTVAADLMRDADVAMYDAKSRGPGRTVTFDLGMREKAVSRLKLEAELRTAVQLDEFRLHYQPIIDIGSGKIVGFEALLRWQRGDSLVYPSEFLQVAEDSGLMNVLGAWVLREAATVAAGWRRQCADLPPFYMSINVAPCQFLQPNFVDQVRDIIAATNVDPRVLVIELTENAAITNREHTRVVLEALRAMGIRLSLDDFGTGYSSFTHLQTLPFDNIKIDRSFVTDGQSNVSWDIIDAMLGIARALNIGVIAEGIETHSQLDRLAAVGCTFGQGFLYDKAITSQVALEKLCATAGYATPNPVSPFSS
ncbi:EAL domain-containing protein [Blastomonas sp. AAP53]|uniref:putative bifunctional diguanylate cyclase/phosphodiesterase n=1 Tax=Blastomonas sp. AAP53 TaxID=1248760 RepID=UPI0002EEC90A|nr:EAL domain-containing protein [Blastomonas sp. AAP53]